jgi:hypothetical protein
MRKEHRPVDPVVEARTRGKFVASASAGVDHHRQDRRHPARGLAADDEDADAGADCFTIREFCRRHRISEAFYHKLKGLGLAPVAMRVGTRVLISREAAAAWRREREAAAGETSTATI